MQIVNFCKDFSKVVTKNFNFLVIYRVFESINIIFYGAISEHFTVNQAQTLIEASAAVEFNH